MKKHELDAAIAAAEAELARLRAVKPEPEPELHPMTLPLERAKHGGLYVYTACLTAVKSADIDCPPDRQLWNTANYYASTEQAARYADAFEVMRLMRRQPGIVDPSKANGFMICVNDIHVRARPCSSTTDGKEVHMFPCFESRKSAEAAVAAVGADRLVRAANWLAGVVE